MGRGLGPCGAGRRSQGFGFGRGSGGFRPGCFGWNRPRWGRSAWGYGVPLAPQDESQALKQEEAYLQRELEAVQQRLAELQGA